jgi:hypothetical protein
MSVNGDTICPTIGHKPIGIIEVESVLSGTKKRPFHIISWRQDAKVVVNERSKRTMLF